jgi:hypothetical protein
MGKEALTLVVGKGRELILPEGFDPGSRVMVLTLPDGSLRIVPLPPPPKPEPAPSVLPAKTAKAAELPPQPVFYLYRVDRLWHDTSTKGSPGAKRKVVVLYRLYEPDHGKLMSCLPVPHDLERDRAKHAECKAILRSGAAGKVKLKEFRLLIITDHNREVVPKAILDRLAKDDAYQDKGLKRFVPLSAQEALKATSERTF